MPRPDDHGGVTMAHEVSVNDPVSHCSFRWMEPWVAPGPPKAMVSCMPRTLHYTEQNIYADAIKSHPQQVSSTPDTTERSEPLGTRRIDGFEAAGVRRTRTRTAAPAVRSCSPLRFGTRRNCKSCWSCARLWNRRPSLVLCRTLNSRRFVAESPTRSCFIRLKATKLIPRVN